MSHIYANDLIETIQALAEFDMSKTTPLLFIGEFRRQLIINNFSPTEAESLAINAKIDLPDGSLDTEQIGILAESFAKIASNMREAFADLGFQDPTMAVVNNANKFSLKLS